ncbi:enoyl-CoA hydratase-related protein [Amycolatopsis palatopharyngis]|uniref:enoyl-CoA hydratase-related protein n=1 Tax=Amycolatopsis palatopharyngis TaxID=187982 RepID=UPI000E2289D6|nr:enoyl-CoA hydratase-related protein [Amycolatopsis palatopharyngis]
MKRVELDITRPPVARLTLSCPDTHNRLSEEMLTELGDALADAESTAAVQVLVLAAGGDTFCAGMELDAIETTWRRLIVALGDLLHRIATSRLVTIALVEGAALGGGVGLLAACDQVVAGERATFRMTEVLLGLVPAAVLPVLARRTGHHSAFGLALTARELSGAEAVSMGLADVYGDEAELRRILRKLRAADPSALLALKEYYAELAPPVRRDELIMEVLGRRLADQAVHERLSGLRKQGLIA